MPRAGRAQIFRCRRRLPAAHALPERVFHAARAPAVPAAGEGRFPRAHPRDGAQLHQGPAEGIRCACLSRAIRARSQGNLFLQPPSVARAGRPVPHALGRRADLHLRRRRRPHVLQRAPLEGWQADGAVRRRGGFARLLAAAEPRRQHGPPLLSRDAGAGLPPAAPRGQGAGARRFRQAHLRPAPAQVL